MQSTNLAVCPAELRAVDANAATLWGVFLKRVGLHLNSRGEVIENDGRRADMRMRWTTLAGINTTRTGAGMQRSLLFPSAKAEHLAFGPSVKNIDFAKTATMSVRTERRTDARIANARKQSEQVGLLASVVLIARRSTSIKSARKNTSITRPKRHVRFAATNRNGSLSSRSTGQ